MRQRIKRSGALKGALSALGGMGGTRGVGVLGPELSTELRNLAVSIHKPRC